MRKTFLAELNNMKDLTLKLSRNDLLLLTEDNQDILKILKSRNIDPKMLRDLDSVNGSIVNLSKRYTLIHGEGMNRDVLPDFVKTKYNKMV